MKKSLTLAIVILPFAVFAHGGHGIFDSNSIIHYLGTPEHALPAFVLAAVAGWVLFRRSRKAKIN